MICLICDRENKYKICNKCLDEIDEQPRDWDDDVYKGLIAEIRVNRTVAKTLASKRTLYCCYMCQSTQECVIELTSARYGLCSDHVVPFLKSHSDQSVKWPLGSESGKWTGLIRAGS